MNLADANGARDATDAPRMNRQGDLCPSWCTTDHNRVLVPGSAIYQDAHKSDRIGSASNVTDPDVMLTKLGFAGAFPEVAVSTFAGHVRVRPDRDAEDLAVFIEQLANVPPSKLALLADQVRAAAAILTGEGGNQ